MSKPKINVLIVDLDNTLYDWFNIWQESFLPIYKGLRDKVKVDVDELEKTIRAVHRKRRTSEYTFLIDELDFNTPDGTSLTNFLKDEIAQSKLKRDLALRLYPTVLKTLWHLKKQNVCIVAYTESLWFYSSYRLKKLGLDGVIDCLFCRQDHDLPTGINVKEIAVRQKNFIILKLPKFGILRLKTLSPAQQYFSKSWTIFMLNQMDTYMLAIVSSKMWLWHRRRACMMYTLRTVPHNLAKVMIFYGKFPIGQMRTLNEKKTQLLASANPLRQSIFLWRYFTNCFVNSEHTLTEPNVTQI